MPQDKKEEQLKLARTHTLLLSFKPSRDLDRPTDVVDVDKSRTNSSREPPRINSSMATTKKKKKKKKERKGEQQSRRDARHKRASRGDGEKSSSSNRLLLYSIINSFQWAKQK